MGETPDRLSGLSDAELVDGGNSGDERALEELYLRYREWVVAAAFRITRAARG